MREIIDKILKSITEFFGKLTKKDKIRLAVIVAVVIILAIVVTVVLGQTKYVVLYTGLEAEEAGEITAQLDELGEVYQTQGTGTILVPQENASRLKMSLAAAGLRSSGFNYDTYMTLGTGFGVTDAAAEQAIIYQTQEFIVDQITMNNAITRCTVIFTPKKDSVFALSENVTEASASIVVEVRGARKLTNEEVQAIGGIVSASVPGLKMENVSLTDTVFNTYSLGGDDWNTGVNDQLALQNEVQDGLEEQVVSLLAPVFGSGAVNAKVSVELDFDDKASESIEFSPPVAGEETGIPVSTSELWVSTRDAAAAEGVPGTDTNGMGSTEYPYGELTDGEVYEEIQRDINYELDQVTTQVKEAKGSIKDLSISVLLDSNAIETDYTERVRALVSNAIGLYDESKITVDMMPFVVDETMDETLSQQESFLRSARLKEIIQTAIMWGVILALGLVALSLLRTVIKSVSERETLQPALAGADGQSGVGGNVDYISYMMDGEGAKGAPGKEYADIELVQKPESIMQLEKFIDKDAASVAQLLRNWLADE
ncbi:MAG: flagellar M-ring protein FliF [Oscillospiraceae bacterium]|jgi:flagellar M-ring protein FliF|nr:flagellar M-ring protein FliF [Oscillospiraceae bacterium]